MGNKINMLASNKIQESRGFEIIGTNPSENSIEELLKNTEYITQEQYCSIFNDCEELRKLLSSITKTMKERKN